ncbi:MAG: NifB/NifX family molybdenum-iron cluster-binding protein [Firmicutes bacterium]|nr:NifB/NifX family molybdenum-iron cluster-binding protein [Bacillota bacterium]
MKVAVATEGAYVAAHFGHCAEYTLFEIADGKVQSRVSIPNPGHSPGFLPEYLAGLGVTHVIAGGMGPRAQELFADRGITTLVGARGPVSAVVEDFLAGRLRTGPSLCHHGEGAPGHGGCGRGGCHGT